MWPSRILKTIGMFTKRGGTNGTKKENECRRNGKMVVKPRRYARHRGDEKRTLVRGGVETASMHDPGKEAAQRPPKGRRKTLNFKTPTSFLLQIRRFKWKTISCFRTNVPLFFTTQPHRSPEKNASSCLRNIFFSWQVPFNGWPWDPAVSLFQVDLGSP